MPGAYPLETLVDEDEMAEEMLELLVSPEFELTWDSKLLHALATLEASSEHA